MIKFFRNIRQNMIKENPPAGRAGKVSNYFFYAIGEIVLVVIGILIALQINNWNEWKKERVKEREILTGLAENLEINIQTLESDIDYLNLVDRSSEAVLSSIYNKLPYSDSLAYHFHLARVPKLELFLSQTGYEEYKNIGLQILTNKNLKDEVITLFESIYPSILSDCAQVNGYYAPFDNFVVQNFIYTDPILVPIDYQKLLTDHFYVSWVRAYKEGRKYLINMDGKLISETQGVLQLIKDELK